jgi:hypothetical protein
MERKIIPNGGMWLKLGFGREREGLVTNAGRMIKV